MAKLQEFQKRVITHGQGVAGLSAGEKALDFTLPNARGKSISLADCLKKGLWY